MHLDAQPRTERTLPEIHGHLQDLCRRQYPEGVPYLYERLLPKLPAFIRALVARKLNLLVQWEAERPIAYSDLEDPDKRALATFLGPQVLRAHMEVGRDATLSNDEHAIAHIETQVPIVVDDLITVASSDDPRPLGRVGCVFVDVDGTKTIVDCTSHVLAGRYLERLAKFLCEPPASVRQWLAERGLRFQTFSYAGDEFVLIVRSEEQPVERSLLDALAVELQKTVAQDPALRASVSFDDPEFVMEYADWSDGDREACRADPAAWQSRLLSSRRKLPDAFVPSFSFGSATFIRGLREALSPDTAVADTLEELGTNAFRLMVERADGRMKRDKRAFREGLEDPKLRDFLLRNAENRRLQSALKGERAKVNRLQRMVEHLRGQIGGQCAGPDASQRDA